MLTKESFESSRDTSTLLPVEENDERVYTKQTSKQSRIGKTFKFFFQGRFFTNGVSLIHCSLIVVAFTLSVSVAYHQGLVSEPLRNVRSFVPYIGPAAGPVVFTDSAEWSGNTTQAAEGWNKWLVNFETHTIAIPDGTAESLGYEPGLSDTKASQRYGISMFHQLHCLATIREFAYLPDALRMPEGKPPLDHDGVSFSGFHMDHCFNYLRQAIECYADPTVEWAKINEEGQRRGIQGWGIPHYQCRDRDALEAFALEHHELVSS